MASALLRRPRLVAFYDPAKKISAEFSRLNCRPSVSEEPSHRRLPWDMRSREGRSASSGVGYHSMISFTV